MNSADLTIEATLRARVRSCDGHRRTAAPDDRHAPEGWRDDSVRLVERYLK